MSLKDLVREAVADLYAEYSDECRRRGEEPNITYFVEHFL